MVSLNFTLLIELILYLVFLWGTGRFILGPILRAIDAREENFEPTQVKTQADRTEAARLEEKYVLAIGETRSQADETYRRTRQQVLQEHMAFISLEKEKADESVSAVRLEAERVAEAARAELLDAAPQLARAITEKLRGGRAS